MNEFQQRAEALAKKDADKRAETWAKIKREAPQIADLLTEAHKHTGKPKAVTVELKNEVILDQGQFDNKPVWDGKLRGYR